MINEPLLLGAVAYDPKVVTIWDGFASYFADHGLPPRPIVPATSQSFLPEATPTPSAFPRGDATAGGAGRR